jgi:hypothetical protein
VAGTRVLGVGGSGSSNEQVKIGGWFWRKAANVVGVGGVAAGQQWAALRLGGGRWLLFFTDGVHEFNSGGEGVQPRSRPSSKTC